MGLECGWRHALKRWSWEFEDFEKKSVGFWPLKNVVGYSTVEDKSWVFYRWGMWFSFSDLNRQRWIETLNITRYVARWGGVSIVWLA